MNARFESNAAATRSFAEPPVVYALGRAAVTLRSDDGDSLRWLDDHLRPFFTPDQPADPVVTLDLIAAPGRFDAHSHQGSSPIHRLPGFALDTRVVDLPAWHEGDAIVLADDELGAIYRVQDLHIDVVGSPGDRRPRIGALRIVREILTAAAVSAAPLLDLHAAAFDASHGAVLVAGPRHSGKTTLLAFAASGGARVIANDRVLVDAASPTVFGIPTLVAVRPDTLNRFAALRGGATGQPTLLRAGEAETAPGAMARGENVRSLSLQEFAARLGTTATGSAPLDAVVFPEIDATASGWTLDVMPPSEGVSRLRGCAYGGGVPRAATVFGRLGEAAALLPAKAGRASDPWACLGSTTTFLRCRLGPDAYAQPAGEWLAALRTATPRGAGGLP